MGEILTVAEVRQAVVTDLPDDTIEGYIGANEALLARHVGRHASGVVSELFSFHTPRDAVAVERRIATLVAVAVDGSPVPLTSAYVSGRVIFFSQSLPPGAVRVDYIPENDTALRKSIVLRMTLIDIAESGVSLEKAGDSERRPRAAKEKVQLIREMTGSAGVA